MEVESNEPTDRSWNNNYKKEKIDYMNSLQKSIDQDFISDKEKRFKVRIDPSWMT